MNQTNPIKRIFDLYTSDLSYQEIEKLIRREAGEVYEFFKSDIPKSDNKQSKFTRGFIFIRSLFNAFILKMTPARRIFYLIALLFFFVGLFTPSPGYTFLAFLIVSLLLAFELADKLSVKGELDVARKIQSDLIPKHPSELNKYQVASFYEPARVVGGDYFDIVEAENGKTYIVLGDISGKGMAAALYMVRVQSIIHLLLTNHSDLREIVINLKKYFSKNLRREYFLTMIAGVIEPDGSLKIVRAGHNPAFLYKKSSGQFVNICPAGMGIGLNDRGVFETTLEEAAVQTEKDDIIFFFTDGVTETMNIRREEFGEENIKRIISVNADKPVEEIKNALLRGIASFRGTANQHDDLTMVILKSH